MSKNRNEFELFDNQIVTKKVIENFNKIGEFLKNEFVRFLAIFEV